MNPDAEIEHFCAHFQMFGEHFLAAQFNVRRTLFYLRRTCLGLFSNIFNVRNGILRRTFFNVRFRSPELGFGNFLPLKYLLTWFVPRQAVETGLRRLSRAGGQVTEAEIQGWAIQFCDGIEKLIHRDRKVHWGYCKIKPRNHNIAETLTALLNLVGF